MLRRYSVHPWKRFSYSISESDAREFVSRNACVRDFLNQYQAGGITYYEKSVGLTRFFRWLKVVKKLDLSPSEFLDKNLKMKNANSVQKRRWALRLDPEYRRDEH